MGVYVVNCSFNGLRAGQLVDIDPQEWQPEIQRRKLTFMFASPDPRVAEAEQGFSVFTGDTPE